MLQYKIYNVAVCLSKTKNIYNITVCLCKTNGIEEEGMALAGGILSAVAVLALLIVGTYAVYIKLRQKYANVKWTLEIVCIGFVLAVSIGVKMAVFCLADKLCTFLDGFNACIRAIYAGIGGLTFEGLESFAEKELIIQLQCA